jgi:two-component system cell cycle sensor histidine kinase/response regulator CckA
MQPHGMFGTIRRFIPRKPDPTPRPVRVLVVDDDGNVCAFVEKALRIAGYETVTAGSGHDALSAFMTAPDRFDVVVTDVRMPHMSGPVFIERLRRLDPDVKVLYFTGFNDQLFHEKTTLWHGEAFLDKPCSVQGLLEAVSLLRRDSNLAGGDAV